MKVFENPKSNIIIYNHYNYIVYKSEEIQNIENFNLFIATEEEVLIYELDKINNRVIDLGSIKTSTVFNNKQIKTTCFFIIEYDYISDNHDIKITDFLNPNPSTKFLCITGHVDGSICLWSIESFISK